MRSTLGRLRSNIYLFFSIFLLYGCSNSPEQNTSSLPNDSNNYIPQVDTSAKRISKHRIDTVVISDLKFHPDEIKVHKGDTVIWINNDLVAHCVSEASSKAWTSLPIPSGGSWKMVVTQNSDYYCAIHLVMKGKIVVE